MRERHGGVRQSHMQGAIVLGSSILVEVHARRLKCFGHQRGRWNDEGFVISAKVLLVVVGLVKVPVILLILPLLLAQCSLLRRSAEAKSAKELSGSRCHYARHGVKITTRRLLGGHVNSEWACLTEEQSFFEVIFLSCLLSENAQKEAEMEWSPRIYLACRCLSCVSRALALCDEVG